MGTGYLYDLAAHLQPIAGLKGTYCGDGNGATVAAMPPALPDTPAAVVLDGDQAVTAASWERSTIAPEAHIYVSQDKGLGASYELARSFKPLVLARIRLAMTTTEIASVVLTSFRAIEDREWPLQSGRHYFVLPCVFEIKVNVATAYQPPA